ncbi:hypothetical protein L596_021964 [Steinernema carpocapsae]|uniref:Transmembrane protein n=1 Tax=Steinernema carpocapsae TaxID=34508 RepID=A0A4U5MKF2_STECR|nr:hypothetical protein L596_021964 [Steinernema carpocapsae]
MFSHRRCCSAPLPQALFVFVLLVSFTVISPGRTASMLSAGKGTNTDETVAWSSSDPGNVTSSDNSTEGNVTASSLSFITSAEVSTASKPPTELLATTKPAPSKTKPRLKPSRKNINWIIGVGVSGGVGILITLVISCSWACKKPKASKDVEKQAPAVIAAHPRIVPFVPLTSSQIDLKTTTATALPTIDINKTAVMESPTVPANDVPDSDVEQTQMSAESHEGSQAGG